MLASAGLCHTEVRALYLCLSCGCLRVATLATVRSGRRSGVVRQMGAFSTAGARRLRALLHYSSSHNRANENSPPPQFSMLLVHF